MTPGSELRWIRPPQQARSQETLERLLDAAETLVAEKGFDDTPVAEVARRAGSSVGAFYTRFPDKDALLHALYVTRVGGDFMHARMLLPDYFLIVAPLAVIPARLPGAHRWLLPSLAAAALAWSTVSFGFFRLGYEGPGPRYVNNEWTIWRGNLSEDNPVNHIRVEPGGAPVPNAGRYHYGGGVGIESFRFTKYGMYEVHYLDGCGLTSPVIGRLGRATATRSRALRRPFALL